jgi:hypothetical protein
LQLLALYDDSSADLDPLEIIAKTCSLKEAFNKVNAEPDLRIVGLGMRFCFNYRRALRRAGGREEARLSFSSEFDWEALINKWMSEVAFAKILDSLEWAEIIERSAIKTFLFRLKEANILARFLTLTVSEQYRFIAIIEPHWICNRLRAEMGASIEATRGSKYRRRLLERIETSCSLVIDNGAALALNRHCNLLPVGIVDIIGDFQRGEIVTLVDTAGTYLGVGIARYRAEDLRQIKGRHSSLINEVLSYSYGNGVLTKNSIALVSNEKRAATPDEGVRPPKAL